MAASNDAQMVLYALVRRENGSGECQFLVRRTPTGFTLPPTKMAAGEDLYAALDRIMEGDLGLPRKSFYPERELEPVDRAPDSPRYEGLAGHWYLYPVAVSLTEQAREVLGNPPHGAAWMSLGDLAGASQEPNTQLLVSYLQSGGAKELADCPLVPSMGALGCYWARFHDGGVRIVRGESIRHILDAGSRALNLRVADPYLPYQRQGLGFTWSFFTHKDKQDLHVHGMPAVEIYGVLEGRLQLWWKPMNSRGVRVWHSRTLEAGDWAEVEPLHCHFAAWLEPEGLGTVIKAAASGELAGVGRLGVAGKTVCHRENSDGTSFSCSSYGNCTLPPALKTLIEEYGKEFADRDYGRIAVVAASHGAR
jgi:hypothetical protein